MACCAMRLYPAAGRRAPPMSAVTAQFDRAQDAQRFASSEHRPRSAGAEVDASKTFGSMANQRLDSAGIEMAAFERVQPESKHRIWIGLRPISTFDEARLYFSPRAEH